jgi:uncharacterized protein YqgQ
LKGQICLFLTGAELRILYWKEFLDKKAWYSGELVILKDNSGK